jgi:Fur family ferric uptake transcriptional regulator
MTGDEIGILRSHQQGAGIRRSGPREEILRVFLKSERHLSAAALHALVKKRRPHIGAATVYRALKVFCDAGLAREVDFGDGTKRFEHQFGHEHHDHLVCLRCGAFEEIASEDIEKRQEALAKKHGYSLVAHTMILYGVCGQCRGAK